MADVFGLDEAPQGAAAGVGSLPPGSPSGLEIPDFLRRNNAEAAPEEKAEGDAAEDNQGDGPVPVQLQGLPEEEGNGSGATPSDEGTAGAEDLELPLPEAPTLASLEKAIRDLREKRKRKVAEWDETIRLLKAQAKKMVDKL